MARQSSSGSPWWRPLWMSGAAADCCQRSARGQITATAATTGVACSTIGRGLAEALGEQGFKVNHKLVGRLLDELDFSLQANSKTRKGASHPDRDAQFEHINAQIKAFQADDQSTISVDTKKKALVGDFKHGGRELRLKGDPEQVRVHDFQIPERGKITPMAFTTLPPMPAGSASASTTTLRPLPWRASAAGGSPSASRAIRQPHAC